MLASVPCRAASRSSDFTIQVKTLHDALEYPGLTDLTTELVVNSADQILTLRGKLKDKFPHVEPDHFIYQDGARELVETKTFADYGLVASSIFKVVYAKVDPITKDSSFRAPAINVTVTTMEGGLPSKIHLKVNASDKIQFLKDKLAARGVPLHKQQRFKFQGTSLTNLDSTWAKSGFYGPGPVELTLSVQPMRMNIMIMIMADSASNNQKPVPREFGLDVEPNMTINDVKEKGLKAARKFGVSPQDYTLRTDKGEPLLKETVAELKSKGYLAGTFQLVKNTRRLANQRLIDRFIRESIRCIES